MFNQIQDYYRRWKSSKNYKYDLDALLDNANPDASLENRLQWLVDLMQWVRYQVVVKEYSEVANTKLPSARIKFLLHLFERNPVWKAKAAKTIRSILRDLNVLDLFTEFGLAEQAGLFGELKERFADKLMPEKPLSEGMATLFGALFPNESDAEWFRDLNKEILIKVIDFIHFEEPADETCWVALEHDVKDALLLLTSQVRAIGLAPSMRRRMDYKDLKDLPFFDFTSSAEYLIEAYFNASEEEYNVVRKEFQEQILLCIDAFNDVYRHLDAFGVSTTIVYLLENAQAKLKRIDDLSHLLNRQTIPVEMIQYFITELIQEHLEKKSIIALLSQNFRLMSRKIVDRSAESGEHYIAKSRKDYFKMLRKAMGGGAITAFTVLVKLVITAMSLPLFMGGLFYSINYAIGFLAIHFKGFTLATKQPAMTGPALANKLHLVNTGAPMDTLVDEIVNLIRTQFIGILGNVITVIPVVALLDVGVWLLIDSHIITNPIKAEYIFASSDVLGPTILYAAFTGVLLWLSSIYAGYVDNWFYLNKMAKVLALNRRLNFIFGRERCTAFSNFLEKNISSIAANISLGFFLGLIPEIFRFFGIPLEVRHVTLSSGTFALGLMHYGLESFYRWDFYSAFIGLGFIGLSNVVFSFSCAFFVAIRSRNISGAKKREIYQAIIHRLKSHPSSFILPPKKKE